MHLQLNKYMSRCIDNYSNNVQYSFLLRNETHMILTLTFLSWKHLFLSDTVYSTVTARIMPCYREAYES